MNHRWIRRVGEMQTLQIIRMAWWGRLTFSRNPSIAGLQALSLGVALTATVLLCVVVAASRIYRRSSAQRLLSYRGAQRERSEALREGMAGTLETHGPEGLAGFGPGTTVIRAIHRRWIAFAAPEGLQGSLSPGVLVSATIRGGSALYAFSGPIVDRRIVDGVSTLFVAKPDFVEKVQRREHFRVPSHLPSALTLIDHRGDGAKTLRGSIDSLSAGGFLVSLPEPLQDGAVVRVRLPVDMLIGYSFEARIVRCKAVRETGNLRFRAHCEFLHLPEETRNLIVSYCFEAEREMRRAMRNHA